MPMIDVYAASGTFTDSRRLAQRAREHQRGSRPDRSGEACGARREVRAQRL